MKETLMRAFRRLEQAVSVINGVLLVGITLIIIVQIVARKAGISIG